MRNLSSSSRPNKQMGIFGCNGEEGLVIPKSHMLFNQKDMKLPIESSAQFVGTNPKPAIDSKLFSPFMYHI